MKCCNGECVQKCKIVDGENCEGSDDDDCRMNCALGELCPQPSQKVWSGFTEKKCNPRGCQGDCSDDTHWCWKIYQCVQTEDYEVCSICTNLVEGPDGIPYPGLYYHCYPVEPAQNKCYSCDKSTDEPETYDVDNDSCN